MTAVTRGRFILPTLISSHTKMLQRLPAAALTKTGAFSASRVAPLRVIQRSSSVGTTFCVSPPYFRVGLFTFLTAGKVRVFQRRVSQRIPGP